MAKNDVKYRVIAIPDRPKQFMVTDPYGTVYHVNINYKDFSCMVWDGHDWFMPNWDQEDPKRAIRTPLTLAVLEFYHKHKKTKSNSIYS